MSVNSLDYNWSTQYKRKLIAFAVSVVLILLLLLIPIHMRSFSSQQLKSIKIEFSEVAVKDDVVENEKPKIIPLPKKIKPQEIKRDKIAASIVAEEVESPVIVESIKPLPSATIILNTFNNRNSYQELDNDFKVRNKGDEDFKFKTIKKSKIYQVTNLINEEVDKPQVQMNFYADGIVGATERFFDKISYKKTFTTRYGTKIYCGGVGPLALCSWK